MKTTGRTFPAASRQYKDTVFRKLFSNETNLLHLYNAVMETEYDRLDYVEITETENPIYIGIRNDVAFFADFHVHIYEHQSTINPNMPLRDLFYVSQLYGKYLADKNLFSAKPVEIPAPNFIVFYNGRQKQPERMEYRLSDLYAVKHGPFQMDLMVQVININAGCNIELLKRCEELRGYQTFVEKVRRYRKEMLLENALDQAVEECIQENILKAFFMEHRKEVVTMSLWEFNQEKYDAMLLEEGEMRGRAEGKAEGRAEERVLLNRLTECLLEDDRLVELKASLQDASLQDKLLKEYCLA